MSSPKKKTAAKAKGKFKDLRANKNPKGGAFDAFIKVNTTHMLNPQPLPLITGERLSRGPAAEGAPPAPISLFVAVRV